MRTYSFILWPILPFVWWYSQGLLNVFQYVSQEIVFQWKKMGIPVLLSHLHKPMYGLDGKWDVFVSMLVRFGHFCVKAFLFFGFALFMGVFLFGYCVFPIVSTYYLLFQLA